MSDIADAQLAELRLHLGPLAPRFDAEVLAECASTNTRLLERAQAGAASGSVCWALSQTAGRGRRGRSWIARGDDSLCFSLLWRFDPRTPMAGLSLAVGLALAEGLGSLGARDLQLKWPNDLWLEGRKLGGVLVELQQSGPRCAAVIGIGLNLRPLPETDVGDQPTAALSEALPEMPPRSKILAHLLCNQLDMLERFATDGFAPFQAGWMNRHALQGMPVVLMDDQGSTSGTCLGVDAEGGLLLEQAGKVQRVLGGDVSLRRRPA